MASGVGYDHAIYGMRFRKWFGLGTKWGGESPGYVPGSYASQGLEGYTKLAGGFFLGTHDPGTLTHVEAWRPQGPISIKKIGVFVCSTSNNASGGGMNFQFLTRGASASVIGTLKFSSCTANENTIAASKTSLTTTKCKAGEYISIQSFEPTTFSATATEIKATTSGRVAFFLDYVPLYDSSRWTNSE